MTRPRGTRLVLAAVVVVLAASPSAASAVASADSCKLTPKEQLGKLIFFDARLSEPPGQACAACHAPQVGFTGPSAFVNATAAVYPGAVKTRFGNRKPPSAAYATTSPVLDPDKTNGSFIGGNFWDGRATGLDLGDPAADQARGPFLNPLEQNNPSAAAVVAKICKGPYAKLFKDVWGSGACSDPQAYDNVARAIAAYEGSREVNAFSSKYDAVEDGKASYTAAEARGKLLFEGKGNCAACHPAPLFTDYTYDNLGVPRNPMNPFYFEPKWNPAGHSWRDLGLGGFLAGLESDHPLASYASQAQANLGKHKVPTLRNVDKRPWKGFLKAYSHNGYFKSLKAIVHFYNTRDALPTCADACDGMAGITCWPAPEVPENVNKGELGNLGLSDEEEHDLVAFLGTLSDGWMHDQH